MGAETYTEECILPFQADNKPDLIGKEHYFVEIIPGTRTVQLFDEGKAIGSIVQDLQGTDTVSVRLIGSEGTRKVKLSGSVAHLAEVKVVPGGTCVAATGVDAYIGILLSPVGGGVSGDIVEILNRPGVLVD